MKLLILGGTGFLGPHIVERAIERGHEMTLFNRGKTNPHLFPDLEKLVGDRDPKKAPGLDALKGHDWDAVIDTSGYYPRVVNASAELLKDHVKQYVFISSVSVYPMKAFREPGVNEETPVDTIEDETIEKITGGSYGPLKALCEQAAEKVFPGRTTNIRPGLIVGPMDRSDRFTYWPVRIDRGGEVLAPGDGSTPVQYIDVRDLANFIISCIEDGHAGIYNALGPASELTMAECLHGIRAITSSPVKFTWADEEFLNEQKVNAWSDMPVWISGEEANGFGRVSNERAMNLGLTFHPLADTARVTLEWHKKERPADYKLRAGLTAEREAEVLKAWHAREPVG